MKVDTVTRLCAVLDTVARAKDDYPTIPIEVKVKVVVHVSDGDWEDEMTDDVEPDEPMNEVAEETNKEPPDGSTDSQQTRPE